MTYGGAVLAKERRRQLLDEIVHVGRVVTSDFAARHGVSDMTVRTDLEYLERQGRVSRTHGGAVPADVAPPIDEFEIRLGVHREAKQRIAAAAVRLITSDEAVILDSGTTVHHLAQAITGVSALTVYTPALLAAQHLMRTDGVDVHLLGGRVIPNWLQTVGTARQLGIKDLIADTLFLGTQGVDDDLDIVEPVHELVATKQRLIRRARRVVLLVDSSKWSRRGGIKVRNLTQIDIVITDAQPPPKVRDHAAATVQFIVA